MEKLVKYAYFNSELIHISKVERGLKCKCICTKCRARLVAKKGEKRDDHFSHLSNSDCQGSYESAIHLLAKKVLYKYKTLLTPKFTVVIDDFEESIESQLIQFEKIKIEQTIRSGDIIIKPDAIGVINNKELFIEFAFSHLVDEIKLKKLKALKKPCIEIDLSDFELTDDDTKDEELLKNLLIENVYRKYWINNPQIEKILTYKLKEKISSLKEEEKRKKEKKRKEEEFDQLYQNEYEIKNRKYKYRKINSNGYIVNCPLLLEEISTLNKAKFIKNDVLRRIIVDKEFWNGQFYRKHGQGQSIYLKNERIIIYPIGYLNPAEKKYYNLLYHGLNEILLRIENYSKLRCNSCIHSEIFHVQGIANIGCTNPLIKRTNGEIAEFKKWE